MWAKSRSSVIEGVGENWYGIQVKEKQDIVAICKNRREQYEVKGNIVAYPRRI